MRRALAAIPCCLFPMVLLASPAAAQGVAIEHQAVGCVVADKFPSFAARLDPAEKVARARLHFKPEGGLHWYSVAMKPEREAFAGVLPKPKKKLKSLRYYIEVTDKEAATSRTEEYAPSVASGPAACKDKVVARTLVSASVRLEVPAGAPRVPPGFGSAGITAVGAGVATAGAAAAGAGAAAGGGLSTGVIVAGVVGGVVVAGGAAAAVALKGGSQDVVLTYAIEAFAYRTLGPTSRVPAQGALVSSSLDGVTTTTDAQGRLTLLPTTPCHTSSDPRGDPGGVVFTVTITASNCPPANFAKKWGCAKVGQFQPQDLNMMCPTSPSN